MNKLEKRTAKPIESKEEAIAIGKKMAKEAGKKLRFNLSTK